MVLFWTQLRKIVELARFGTTVTRALERFDGTRLIIGIFVASLGWAASMASVGWDNGLSIHGFRQTQTAITSYYLAHGGPFLRYETPIFGYPWSIPFEFPLYQWIVAFTSRFFHLQLEPSGRIVSEVFFALSLVTMWAILSELRVRRVHRLIFLTLTLVSPQYIYWPRTFMIESTALFFCMAYLCFIIRYIRTRKTLDVCLGGLFGLLGALVKITTLPAFALVGGLIFIVGLRRDDSNSLRADRRLLRVYLPHLLPMLCFFCLPVLVTWAWVNYTDQLKALNLVSNGHLTSVALQKWNFGTLEQRFLASSWKRMLSQTIPDLSGPPIFLLLPCFGLYFAAHRVVPFLISIAGFLSAFLIFTNLHVIHEYYACANGVFLIAAMSWCIVGLLEGSGWHKALGIGLFAIGILNSSGTYYKQLYGFQKSEGRAFAELAFAIKNVTRPNDVIVIFQRDWSSELPYYSERRALMWPAWMEQDMDAPAMRGAIAKLGDYRIGAVVFCDYARANSLLITRAQSVLGTATRPSFEDATCALYPSKTS